MTFPTAAPRLDLLVDADTGSDDAVALILAARAQQAHVHAVTTVAGNVSLAQATRNALYTLELAGRADVPVHPGCDRPLLRPHQSAQHVHGQDGMSDTDLPEPSNPARTEHAVDALLRLVGEHPDRTLTLVTLGPLTNLAAVLVRDPSFLDRLRHVYCMAGAADMVGNISASAEYNVWADPEAAAVVLRHATPDRVTLVGWDVSRTRAVMTAADQDRLARLGTPLAVFANDINQAVNDWTTNVTGLAGYDLPDPITMAVALDPSIVTKKEEVRVAVGLGPEVRGQLIIDRRHDAEPPNVTIVRDADEASFKAMLFAACGAEVVPS